VVVDPQCIERIKMANVQQDTACEFVAKLDDGRWILVGKQGGDDSANVPVFYIKFGFMNQYAEMSTLYAPVSLDMRENNELIFSSESRHLTAHFVCDRVIVTERYHGLMSLILNDVCTHGVVM